MNRLPVLFLLFLSTPVWATTYYVRDGGGTSTQCTGTTNATYPGSGTGQPCAFKHPRYIMGWGCGSSGTSCAGGANNLSAGDTVSISGDSDLSPGSQAKYEIGYDDTGGGLTPGCSTFFPWDCTLGNVPAGSDSSHKTTIIGTGTHQPQLWGTQRVWVVFIANNNNISLQNLEITDHSSCGKDFPSNACNYSGSYPFGSWAEDGLLIGGTGNVYQNIYVHGVGRYGVFTASMGTDTFTNFSSIGNGQGGYTSDPAVAYTGTLTWNQPIVEWNGCQEAYPLTFAGIDNASNYSVCSGQANGIIADGIAFGASGSSNSGNWTIIGPGSISFNTQDGFDTLHGVGNGIMQIDKMRFEGNAGNQIKMNGLTTSLTNSVIFGDCGWWYQAAQSYSGFTAGDICRALGDVLLFNVSNNSTTNLFNNTFVSNGNISLESRDFNSTGCNGGTTINEKNNIILGGYSWIDDTTFGGGGNSQTTYIYNAGNDGNGGGTCGGLTWNEDYNIVTGTKNSNSGCNGAHDKCGTSPGFTGTVPVGTAGGGANTYYQGTSGVTLIPISSGSAAKVAGVGGLSYWNNGNDYYNVGRPNPPSMGCQELSSCGASSYGCQFNSSCCSGTCSNNACTSVSSVKNVIVCGNVQISGNVSL